MTVMDKMVFKWPQALSKRKHIHVYTNKLHIVNLFMYKFFSLFLARIFGYNRKYVGGRQSEITQVIHCHNLCKHALVLYSITGATGKNFIMVESICIIIALQKYRPFPVNPKLRFRRNPIRQESFTYIDLAQFSTSHPQYRRL